jgi:hypothetical protein
MMSHYFAGDAPWVVVALLLAVFCLFLRRFAPTKVGESVGPPEHPREPAVTLDEAGFAKIVLSVDIGPREQRAPAGH